MNKRRAWIAIGVAVTAAALMCGGTASAKNDRPKAGPTPGDPAPKTETVLEVDAPIYRPFFITCGVPNCGFITAAATRLGATLTTAGGVPVGGADISLRASNGASCIARTDGAGRASCEYSTYELHLPATRVEGRYEGDGEYLPSASAWPNVLAG